MAAVVPALPTIIAGITGVIASIHHLCNRKDKQKLAALQVVKVQKEREDDDAKHKQEVADLENKKTDSEVALNDKLKQVQGDSDEKIRKLNEERKQATENWESMRGILENASREERDKMTAEHNRVCKEKDTAIENVRNDQKKEEKKLREEYQKEKKIIDDQLAAEKENRLKDEKAQSEKTEAIQRELQEMVEAKQKEILALRGDNHHLHLARITAQYQNDMNNFRMLNNFISKNAIEKDSKSLEKEIQSMLHLITKMENEALNNDQVNLSSMTEDIPTLENMIKSTLSLLQYSSFPSDLKNDAKHQLNVALDLAATMFDEVISVREKMDEDQVSVSLDGIAKCLWDLSDAINSIPSMVTETMLESIHEHMERFTIQPAENAQLGE